MVLVPKFWSDLDLEGISLGIFGKGGWVSAFGKLSFLDQTVTAEQVHGDQVAVVNNGDLGKVVKGSDGLLTQKPNLWLEIKVADCIPLFVFSGKKAVVGIAHLGWRGLLGDLLPNFIKTALDLGGLLLKDLRVIMGPSIGPCCYQVDEKLSKKFQLKFGDHPGLVITNEPGRYLNLRLACLLALKAVGIKDQQVWAPITCTACQPHFYSYRASGGKPEGYNRCLIGIKPGPSWGGPLGRRTGLGRAE